MFELVRQRDELKNLKNREVVPEVWGGIECTINRVQNNFYDQLEMAGHYSRDSDIDLIAGLGVKKLRFPIIWEKHEPERGAPIDWSWTDNRLQQLRQHGITPIVGLVHHGSGPAYTNLGSRSFAMGLGNYAAKVAARYPWIEYYTPVNEPLTTARFSGLYGHWYPHHTSETAFCTMLLNQLKATVLAMREIRKINPNAKLVQTEDLGKTYAVPPLQYQADFENDRRWISYDLLCGKVDEQHPLWDYFMRARISEHSLLFFKENPCPPDVLGLNYYVTSERFLDNRLENYPEHLYGGNWLERYVDTEAIRVDHGQPSGLNVLLHEVEERYQLPIAITEAHLHCTAEESARWFKEVWDICCEHSKGGSPVLAVTAWSLFGAYGWDKLLTSANHEYENGAFDLRGNGPRPTVTAKLIEALASGKEFLHPVLTQKGWWHRADRFLSGEIPADTEVSDDAETEVILIVGNEGPMLRSFTKICEGRSLPHEIIGEEMVEYIGLNRYWAVIHLAEESNISTSESLAKICSNQTQFMCVGAAEYDSLSEINPAAIVISVGTIFNAESDDELISSIEANTGQSYSYLPDVTNVSLDLLIREEHGLWHLVNGESEMMPRLEDALQRCNAFSHRTEVPV